MGQLNGCETSKFPNGNINIATFVKLDTANEGYVLQAGSGDRAYGVCGVETHIMSITISGTNLDDGFAGVAGGPAMKIYGNGATKVPMRIIGTTNIGDLLKPDTGGTGAGMVTTSSGDKVGARALQAGTANQIIEVDVVTFDI
jgi:hypothetical protein